MVRIKYWADKAGHDIINKTYEERVGFKIKVIEHVTTSDRATKDIATMLNQDEDFCDVYDCDRVGKLKVGDLVRTINKV